MLHKRLSSKGWDATAAGLLEALARPLNLPSARHLAGAAAAGAAAAPAAAASLEGAGCASREQLCGDMETALVLTRRLLLGLLVVPDPGLAPAGSYGTTKDTSLPGPPAWPGLPPPHDPAQQAQQAQQAPWLVQQGAPQASWARQW